MSKKIIVRVFIVLFVLNITDAIKEICSKEEDLQQRCSMALPILSSPEISFALTRDELDKTCIELRAGIKCIDNYTEVCMEKNEQNLFQKVYAGIRGVVHKLCTRGKYQDDYLKYASCVKNVRSEYETCSEKYEVTLTTFSHPQKKDQYSTDQNDVNEAAVQEEFLRTVCCSVQEYLLCSEQTVQRSCGDDAALFTSAFLKEMTSNIIKTYCLEYRGQECELSGKATHTSQSVLLVGIILISHLVIANIPENLGFLS